MSFLDKLPQYNLIKKDLDEKRCIQIEGCVPSQMEHLISETGKDFDLSVIITGSEQDASGIINNYLVFDREALYYPARDKLFYKADIRGSYLSDQRAGVVRRICENRKCTIVTTIDAFFEELIPVSRIEKETIILKTGDMVDEHELSAKLTALGYNFESQISAHGEYSIRGSIIDIYPYTSEVPYRIDLFGDEIDTIKTFDIDSQRSTGTVDEMEIFSGADRDEELTEERNRDTSGFLDYFDGKKVLFSVYEPVRIIKNELGLNPLTSVPDDGEIIGDITAGDVTRVVSVLKQISQKPCILFSSLGEKADDIIPYRVYRINARNIPSYNGRFQELVADLRKYRKEGYEVVLECAGETRTANMIRNLADNGITVGRIEEDRIHHIKASDIQVRPGSVRTGFEYPDIKFSLISESDIFGARRQKKRKRRYSGDPIKEFTDLNIGDYVVHEQHGVGVYEGIERIKVDGIEKDYMKIGYANNASLFVLATQFDKIQKYGGSEGAKPKINRLGGKEWTNTRARVKAAVEDIAQDLVKLYAERQLQKGFRFSPDTVWQREFEDGFEFEETEDQILAIEDVKNDMESGRIMDRLICGDVGFGKTEVAIRAAFKAVQDGKQVAFLTPTTILAQQHYTTISKRLENYPVTVEMMSRFASKKEQNQVLKDLTKGQTDIVVGTHRLLSDDIKFKDLGLLVIDEEQRFGVKHKEKIKQLRKNVDVITLSATPIPRTLHMSLTGIRDMSILREPPVDRLPIQTYVMEYSEEAVKEAIIRETARGGQIYYVYNRTNNIDMVADRLKTLVPHVNIAYAHGKMASRELEQIMFDFIDGQIDVLVSTTIIETGLDIPNVNTIIIHDADNFGLSQLYQLRGRVGRSNKTAYAFLMYRKDKLIKEVAEKRLKAIREFSDLGSGIRIAMRDLEIRGAGNVLGAEQSGHMEAVGYELYCKMLNQAVAMLKGEAVAEDFETTVDLDIDGFIPDTYIKNEFEKLNMYKKISAISDMEDMEDIIDELIDRFGDIPKVTENLLHVAYIKAKAHECFVTEISNAKPVNILSGKKQVNRKTFKILMKEDAPFDSFKVLEMLRERQNELKFTSDGEYYFLYTPEKTPGSLAEIQKTLTEFFDILLKTMVAEK